MPELMFAQLLWIGCTLQIVQAACTEQTADQPATTECKTSMCNVLIGGTGAANQYCSQCAKAAEAPINGVCKAISSDASGCVLKTPTADGTCTQCGNGYFLYKGGCYGTGDTTGQKLCTTAATEGVCTVAATGYFAVPGAAKTDQSVAACGDATTGVTIGGNKKYVGVDGCTKCTKPELLSEAGTKAATCEACSAQESTPRIVKTAAGVTSCVTEAQCTGAEGFFVKGQGGSKTCEACSDATKGGVKGCTACAANADTPDQAKCTACTLPKKPSQNGRNCYNCDINGCMYCSANDACEVCIDGYRKNGSNCEKCTVDKCKACPDAVNTCTACSEGYTLDGGKCASSSANKSGLSTGAIAGISVAAVVVVGGLVGFLCWWFVCRGKA